MIQSVIRHKVIFNVSFASFDPANRTFAAIPRVEKSRCAARLQHGANAAAMGTAARQLRAPLARF
jgi:hypothetical protein